MLNLDTHILLFALTGDLTEIESTVLRRERWGIASIVLWEITKLYERRRISFGLNSPQLINVLDRLEIWDLSRAVCQNVLTLDFDSEPADEIIAATSLTYKVPLVTRDSKIRASKLLEFAT